MELGRYIMLVKSRQTVFLLRPKNVRFLKWLFIQLAALNLIDGLLTYGGVANDIISEANPLMRRLWEINPGLFIGVKAFLSGLLIILANYDYRLQFQFFIGFVLTIIILLYGVVIILHLYWIILFL